MKKDITSRKDIELLIKIFYEKVTVDQLLGPIFNDVANINWEKHLPIMCNFWENLLFFTGTYQGNPMELHKHLHKMKHLEAVHFQQWNHLFISTIDQLFEGKNALIAKQRAMNISSVMQFEILK